jgi:hypothetical protein
LQHLSINPTMRLSPAPFTAFCKAISEIQCLDALETLSIEDDGDYGWPSELEDLETESLRCLFRFKNLTQFTLYCDLHMRLLGDDILLEMGKAWPRLQALLFPSCVGTSSCTLLGICYMLEFCPNLSVIHMQTWSNIPNPDDLKSTRLNSYPQLDSLWVFCMDIQVDATVDFMRTRFPSLRSISIPDYDSSFYNKDHFKKWKSVARELGTTSAKGYPLP